MSSLAKRALRVLLGDVVPLLLACITVLALIAPMAAAAMLSPQARACAGYNGLPAAEFDVPEARSIWSVFPAMLRAPELENDVRPAHVVVFEGVFDLAGLVAGQPGSTGPTTVTGVVCVVQADGTLNLYTKVSRAGFAAP
jgi:hypothetical protein